jgi:hypothetical protein
VACQSAVLLGQAPLGRCDQLTLRTFSAPRRSSSNSFKAPEEIMAISDQTAREIVKIIRKHVDQPTLDKMIEELQEVRGDKGFRDIVQLFAYLAQTPTR